MTDAADQVHVWVAEAARIIGVGDNLVRKWFDEGRLDGYTLPDSGYRRITLDSVARMRDEIRNTKREA